MHVEPLSDHGNSMKVQAVSNTLVSSRSFLHIFAVTCLIVMNLFTNYNLCVLLFF